MPTSFNVRALGSVVRVELDDTLSDDERELIAAQWVDSLTDDESAPAHTIRAGVGSTERGSQREGSQRISAGTPEELADRITSSVTFAGIRLLSGDALMLHAGAVALDDGRVLGFIGPSGRGKTTATRALGAEFAYVTDETLAVRADGSVVPYPKPLSLGDRPMHKEPVAASSLGLRPAVQPDLQLAALVLLDRQPGVSRPRIESVSLTDALPDVIPQTSSLAQMDRPLRTLVELITSTGGVRRVVYSEASTLPGLIDEILATTVDDRAMLTDVAVDSERDCGCSDKLSPGDRTEAGSGSSDPRVPGTYRRHTHADAILRDDQLFVLKPRGITVLEGLGPILWLAADDSTEDDLRAAALSQLPEPPAGVDASSVVSEAIRELVDAQLLVRA